MYNIISFLVIVVVSLLGIKSNYVPNQLLDFGLVLLFAYLLSVTAVFLKQPAVFGAVLAGIIAGPGGLGLVTMSFLKDMEFVESIVVMLVLAHISRYAFHTGHPPKAVIRFLATGALTALVTFMLALGFFAPLSLELEKKVILGLVSATFSPMLLFIGTEKDESPQPLIILALGAFLFSVVLWGVMTAYFSTSGADLIKLALMPIFFAVTSLIAGIVWGFIAEKLLYHHSESLNSLYPLLTIFLAYPLVSEFGFDYLFLAIGIGLYNGTLAERMESLTPGRANLPILLVFALFGIRLSLQDAVLLDSASWSVVAIVATFFIFTRFISTRLTLHLASLVKQVPPVIRVVPCGPLTLILFYRFLPGFSATEPGKNVLAHIDSLVTTSILVIFGAFFVVSFVYSSVTSRERKRSGTPSK